MSPLIASLESPVDLALLLLVALLLFGAKRLPEVARSLGNGIREFRNSIAETGVDDALREFSDLREAASPRSIVRKSLSATAETQASDTRPDGPSADASET